MKKLSLILAMLLVCATPMAQTASKLYYCRDVYANTLGVPPASGYTSRRIVTTAGTAISMSIPAGAKMVTFTGTNGKVCAETGTNNCGTGDNSGNVDGTAYADAPTSYCLDGPNSYVNSRPILYFMIDASANATTVKASFYRD